MIADDTADAEMVRHRPARPGGARADLPRDSADHVEGARRGDTVEIERQLHMLPTAEVAGAAWRDYGEVIVVRYGGRKPDGEADQIACEHVEVLTREPGVVPRAA